MKEIIGWGMLGAPLLTLLWLRGEIPIWKIFIVILVIHFIICLWVFAAIYLIIFKGEKNETTTGR